QRNKLFPRRLRLRIAIHESLNRNAIPLSRKILPAEHRKDGYPTWAVTKIPKFAVIFPVLRENGILVARCRSLNDWR
ncbi:MAG TPA: hypothetical protein VKT99_07960, partial [Xanthobacteraceae bacterium]|nr:hypothetical protein [Xanthobacteraceae bacterium]